MRLDTVLARASACQPRGVYEDCKAAVVGRKEHVRLDPHSFRDLKSWV